MGSCIQPPLRNIPQVRFVKLWSPCSMAIATCKVLWKLEVLLVPVFTRLLETQVG